MAPGTYRYAGGAYDVCGTGPTGRLFRTDGQGVSVSLGTSVRRGLDYYSENGAISTAGAVAEFCGRETSRRCHFLANTLETDRGRGYSLSTRVRAARQGLSAHTYLWLGLEEADVDRYLSSTDPIRRVNEGYIEPIHHKYVFQLNTAPYVERLPRLYGTIDAGEFSPARTVDDDLPELLSREGTLVVKPVDSGRGNGVAVLRADGPELTTGGETVTSSVRESIAGLDGYLVTELVRQHDYAASVFPDATNTLRIHSLADPDTGEVGLLRASHRFGSRQSVPTDNWSRGGYTAPVDLDTGEIRPLIALDDPPRSRPEHHPETGAQVAGLTVPHWAAVCDLVREAAELHRYAPFVGWDVAVSPEGPVLIEGNARPSIVGLQLTEGVLTDPRVRTLLGRG